MSKEFFTPAEAAEACHCSRSTVMKRIKDGKLPQATKTDEGIWQIPLSDLVAAHMLDGVTSPTDTEEPTDTAELVQLRHKVEMLASQNAHLKARLNDSLQHIADLRSALKMLEPPQPTRHLQGDDIDTLDTPVTSESSPTRHLQGDDIDTLDTPSTGLWGSLKKRLLRRH